MNESETIAAIATAPGRGGVAVVRVSGPQAHDIASAITGHSVDASMSGRFFHAQFQAGGRAIDDGLVLVFASPRSYTGEDIVEFQGHGGSIAPRRVLEACIAAGARLARRGEFTERAFLNGRLDLGAAEAVIDLVDARTERAADDAVARLGGAGAKRLEEFYLSAIEISSRIEHSLDFDEEELPPGFGDDLLSRVNNLHASVSRSLSTAREGRILREGALVVLAGAPNAGKSSLLNALLGTGRAIVSDEAGTTRDSIEEWMEIGGWPVRLVDTAGLRTAAGAIEAEGVARAETLIDEADIVLHLIPTDASIDSQFQIHGKQENDVINVISKCDVTTAHSSPASFEFGAATATPIRISSKTGYGLDDLKTAIALRLAQFAAKDDGESGADVTTRQKECLLGAHKALERASSALIAFDWVVAANELRAAAESFGRVLGKVYSEDLLDAIFSRFCVGK